MELDINIVAHDLLWRRMSLTTKKAYRESFGTSRKELLEREMQRLIDAGYATKVDADFALTPAGHELYKKMMSVCKKSE